MQLRALFALTAVASADFISDFLDNVYTEKENGFQVQLEPYIDLEFWNARPGQYRVYTVLSMDGHRDLVLDSTFSNSRKEIRMACSTKFDYMNFDMLPLASVYAGFEDEFSMVINKKALSLTVEDDCVLETKEGVEHTAHMDQTFKLDIKSGQNNMQMSIKSYGKSSHSMPGATPLQVYLITGNLPPKRKAEMNMAMKTICAEEPSYILNQGCDMKAEAKSKWLDPSGTQRIAKAKVSAESVPNGIQLTGDVKHNMSGKMESDDSTLTITMDNQEIIRMVQKNSYVCRKLGPRFCGEYLIFQIRNPYLLYEAFEDGDTSHPAVSKIQRLCNWFDALLDQCQDLQTCLVPAVWFDIALRSFPVDIFNFAQVLEESQVESEIAAYFIGVDSINDAGQEMFKEVYEVVQQQFFLGVYGVSMVRGALENALEEEAAKAFQAKMVASQQL